MGQDITFAQPCQHIWQGWRRIIDMDHEWHIDLVSNLSGNVERHQTGIARGMETDPYLDASQRIAMRQRDIHCVEWSHQSQVAAFSHHDPLGKTIYAGKRDIQIGNHPNR